RLLLRVEDVMRTGDLVAKVGPQATVKSALFAITRAQAGCVFIVGPNGQFQGLLSQGDGRRLLVKDQAHLPRRVHPGRNRSPRYPTPDRLVTEALELMQQHPACGEMPVLDDEGRPVGVLNLKDIVRTGIL